MQSSERIFPTLGEVAFNSALIRFKSFFSSQHEQQRVKCLRLGGVAFSVKWVSFAARSCMGIKRASNALRVQSV